MCISVVLARGLVAEVERLGFDSSELLRQSEIARPRLLEARQMLSSDEVDRLVGHALTMTSDLGLGLSIAQHAPEAMLQVVGQLLLSQPTLRHAFSVLQRYVDLLAVGVTFSLDEVGDTARFDCAPPTVGAATRVFMDLTLALAVRVARYFTLDRVVLRAVHLQHARPDYRARYEELFDCPVVFDQPSYGLVVERSCLDVQQPYADVAIAGAAEGIAQRMLYDRLQNVSTTERVLALLQHERDWNHVDVQRLARQLGLTVRSLRRRLSAERATISELLDETRCRIACEELSRSGSSIKEVAELLNFSEPSAFHRAFRRWTGRTPGEYLAQERWRPASEIMLTTRRPAPGAPGKERPRERPRAEAGTSR